MTTTFNDLSTDGQLQFANALETWARSVRAAHRWRESRRREAAGAEPPLHEATLTELTARLNQGYADRIGPLPAPADFVPEPPD